MLHLLGFLLVAMIIGFLCMLYSLYHRMLSPPPVSYEVAIAEGQRRGDFGESPGNLGFEGCSVVVPGFGEIVYRHGRPREGEPCGTIIMVHGIAWNWYGMFKYSKIFQDLGFEVMLLDLPGHGDSSPAPYPIPSYGYFESLALAKFCEKLIVEGRMNSTIPWGFLGESMGGSVVIQAACLDPKPSFVIADGTFTDAYKILNYRASKVFPGGQVFMPLVQFFCKLLRHWNLKDASPFNAVSKLDMPLMLVHGLEDRYVPWTMSVDLFCHLNELDPEDLLAKISLHQDQNRAFIEESWKHVLVLIPLARHAASVRHSQGLWARAVESWLSRQGFL